MNNTKQNKSITPDQYEKLATQGVTNIAKKAREKEQLISKLNSKKEKIVALKEEIQAAKEELREVRKDKRKTTKAIRTAKRYIVSESESVESLNTTLMNQKTVNTVKVKKHT